MVMVWGLIYYFVSVFSVCNFVSVLFLLSIGINCFIINILSCPFYWSDLLFFCNKLKNELMKSVYDFSLAELKNLDQQTFEYLISQGNRSLDESIKSSSTLSQRAYTVMAFVFAFFSFAMESVVNSACLTIKVIFTLLFVTSLVFLFLSAKPYKIKYAGRIPAQINLEGCLRQGGMAPYHYLLAAELSAMRKDIEFNKTSLEKRTRLFVFGLLMFFISYLVIIVLSMFGV